MLLLIDNFDSFTYNLVDYLAQLGATTKVVRNDVSIESIIEEDYDGVIFSPGPETPLKSGNLMAILDYYVGHLPILGICVGHQAIGQYFGADLVHALKPMHGKISGIDIQQDQIFHGIPERINVVRYNSLILKNITEQLKCLAMTDDNEVMALKHNELPIWGLQFHPEAALTDYGLQMLKNWLSSNSIII